MEAIPPKLHVLLDAKMMLQDHVLDGFQLNYKLSGDVLCLFNNWNLPHNPRGATANEKLSHKVAIAKSIRSISIALGIDCCTFVGVVSQERSDFITQSTE